MSESSQLPDDDPQGEFEQELTSQLAREFLKEQRRSRRWGIFFKLFFAAYLLVFILIFSMRSDEIGGSGVSGKAHTALIEIEGIIGAGDLASADNIVSGLRAAYENDDTAGIILRINSPGGSPVQSGYVNDEIHRLREEYPEIPVYAVIGDLCASGGYYIASAAESIYADKASLVGSIGVIMAGFGFVDAIDKLGVQRRVLAAGDNKAFLDPFAPLKDEEVAHVDTMLSEIHEQFKEVVRRGRGDRLVADEQTVFSGLIWTGERAMELGLVDRLGSSSYVAREVIGAEDIVNYSYRPNYLDRFVRGLGASLASQLNSYIKLQLIQ